MDTSLPPILSAHQLCADSPLKWRAINNTTFTVAHGECIAVIGPNGSGKSSLLKTILGEYHAVQGQLQLNGIPTDDLTQSQKAKMIALVAQQEHVDPRLTVFEYVSLGRVPHTFCCGPKEHDRAVKQAIDDVGLSHKSHQCVGVLSGGELQRANIARAFAQEPKLLLLDEPTNHLDPLARFELLALIKRKGVSSIVVLHDLPLVTSFADKVLLMANQSMVTFAPPHQVMNDQFITPTFGLRVITLNHPQIPRAVHHFEAAPSHLNLSPIGVSQ